LANFPPPNFSAVPPITADMVTLAPKLIFPSFDCIKLPPSEDMPNQTILQVIIPGITATKQNLHARFAKLL
jgi:hypothetical protein